MVKRLISKLNKPSIVSILSIFGFVFVAAAGSLTPSASPAPTMHTLQELYDSLVGTFDSSSTTSNVDGNVLENLKYIESNLGWASSSNDIYNVNTGNVGIGDTTPETKFEVVGAASVSQLYVDGTLISSFGVSSNSLDFDEFENAMNLDADTTITGGAFSLTFDHASVSGNFEVRGTASVSALLINGSSPLSASVSSNLTPSVDNTYNLGSPTLRWKSLYLGPGSLHISSTTGTSGAGSNYTDGSLSFTGSSLSFSALPIGSGASGSITFSTGTNKNLHLASTGNVGIGTVSPVAKLELSGDAQGFMDTSAQHARRYVYSPTTWSTMTGTISTARAYASAAIIGDYVYLFGGITTGSVASNTIQKAQVSDPTTWTTSPSGLPGINYNNAVAVIGDYVYSFGGSSSTGKMIWRAPLNNPTSWSDTGSTLPVAAGGSALAVIGDYVYLFGGDSSNAIQRAALSSPTVWTNTGSTIPGTILRYTALAVIGDYVYLFGGYDASAQNTIYRAPISDPLTWTNTGATLPSTIYGSSASVIGDYVYLFGGVGTNIIWKAPVSNPTRWSNTGSTLPANDGVSQLVQIGDYVYLLGGHNGATAVSAIYRTGTKNAEESRFWKYAPAIEINRYQSLSTLIHSDGAGSVSTSGNFEMTGYASISNTLWVSPPGNTGNVGIGERSPTAKLELSGGAASISNVLYVENGGNVGIGTTAPETKLHVVADTPADANLVYFSRASNDTTGTYLGLRKARGTHASFSDVQNGDGLGGITFNARTGSVWRQTSSVEALVDGTFTSGQRPPSALQLFTNIANTAAVERMRITANGFVGIRTTAPKGPLFVLDTLSGSTSSGSFAIRSSNNVASVASISATSLTTGIVMSMTVPTSASQPGVDYLVVKDTAGQVYASLGAGGTLTLRRNLFTHGSTTNCTGANAPSQGCIDYAESFPTSDSTLSAGDVVAVDPYRSQHVIRADSSSAPLGIVSTNPATLINANSFSAGSLAKSSVGTVPIALAGRVPVKISDENGPILPGDHLTVSATKTGYAAKQIKAGTSLGIALESPNSATVMTFVNTSYWAPSIDTIVASASSSISGQDSWDWGDIFQHIVDAFRRVLGIGFEDRSICLGETCINEEQLRQLMEQSGSSSTPVPQDTEVPTASPTLTPTPSDTPTPTESVTPTPSDTPTPEPAPTETSTETPTEVLAE